MTLRTGSNMKVADDLRAPTNKRVAQASSLFHLAINRQDACSTFNGRSVQRQAQGGELCRTKIARYQLIQLELQQGRRSLS